MTKKRTLLTDLAVKAKTGTAVGEAPVAKATAKDSKTAGPKPARKPRAAKPSYRWTPSAKPKPLRDYEADSLSAMNVRMPKEMHRSLKIRGAEEDRTMNDLIVEAIHNYLRRASGPAR
ncbi:toxin-antitoxin system HicB family antitoxin [Sulfitobacter sp. 1A13730]|uniref:toxin-antitoxin system HicB family antitoxin n=1 Tax=Sulfitobacter sp. 1A13730 TaxID=3368569 RepID=UPI0037472538